MGVANSRFDFEVRHQKGTKNQLADHLSRFKEEAMLKLADGVETDDMIPDEQVLAASHDCIFLVHKLC